MTEHSRGAIDAVLREALARCDCFSEDARRGRLGNLARCQTCRLARLVLDARARAERAEAVAERLRWYVGGRPCECDSDAPTAGRCSRRIARCSAGVRHALNQPEWQTVLGRQTTAKAAEGVIDGD